MFTKTLNQIRDMSTSLFNLEQMLEREIIEVAKEQFKEAGMPSVVERTPEPWLLDFLRRNKIGVPDIQTTTYTHQISRFRYDIILNTLKAMCNK